MYRFIETIRIENHRLQYLEGHTKRLNETRRHFFPSAPEVDLAETLVLPSNLDDGVYKCRIVYGEQIEDVTFQPYMPKLLRSLRLVTDDKANYSYKYENRAMLELLLTQKGEADDILIVRDHCITDTSYSNVALLHARYLLAQRDVPPTLVGRGDFKGSPHYAPRSCPL
jgi:4-amino-4-deoxychorismate lyase